MKTYLWMDFKDFQNLLNFGFDEFVSTSVGERMHVFIRFSGV